jgi:hypothetical protein
VAARVATEFVDGAAVEAGDKEAEHSDNDSDDHSDGGNGGFDNFGDVSKEESNDSPRSSERPAATGWCLLGFVKSSNV